MGAGIGEVVVRYEAGYAEGKAPAGLLAAVRAVLSIYYDKPQGQELRQSWDAVDRSLIPFRLRSL
jgi:hypothetical protein